MCSAIGLNDATEMKTVNKGRRTTGIVVFQLEDLSLDIVCISSAGKIIASGMFEAAIVIQFCVKHNTRKVFIIDNKNKSVEWKVRR